MKFNFFEAIQGCAMLGCVLFFLSIIVAWLWFVIPHIVAFLLLIWHSISTVGQIALVVAVLLCIGFGLVVGLVMADDENA